MTLSTHYYSVNTWVCHFFPQSLP